MVYHLSCRVWLLKLVIFQPKSIFQVCTTAAATFSQLSHLIRRLPAYRDSCRGVRVRGELSFNCLPPYMYLLL